MEEDTAAVKSVSGEGEFRSVGEWAAGLGRAGVGVPHGPGEFGIPEQLAKAWSGVGLIEKWLF